MLAANPCITSVCLDLLLLFIDLVKTCLLDPESYTNIKLILLEEVGDIVRVKDLIVVFVITSYLIDIVLHLVA